MRLGLEDRVVVVTGAASGIGEATSALFVEEGARVVAGDLDEARLASLGERLRVATEVVDLATEEGPRRLVERAIAEHGRIDVLVNNVGLAPFRAGFLDTSEDDWRTLLDVNFHSMRRCSHAAIPHMVDRGRGSIVSIASDVGRQPDPFFVDYAVTKAAMIMLSKALSIEFGPHGVRSNVVSPGPTRTPLWDRPGGFADALADEYGLEKEAAIEHFAKDVRKLPTGRLGRPEDVAHVVAFLASDLAAQVTGSEYCVNGGALLAA